MTIEYKDSKRITALSTHPVLDTATYTDDFSSDNWTDNGTPLNKVNTSTGVLDWNASRSGSNEKTVYDLGAGNVSNTAWVLRFKWTIVNHTGGSGSDPDIFFGLCDTPQTTSITDSSNTAFGIRAHGGATNNMYVMSQDNADLWHASSKDYEFTETPTIGTYYVEIRKTGSLTGIVTLFSDSNYSTTIESSGQIALENTDGLRYIFFANYPLSATTPPFNGTVDDLKFYNGISSLTTKPSDVQDNSILVEKDTARRYWFSKAPVTTDDLTTDKGWVSNTSDWTYNASGDYIDFATIRRSTTAQQIYIDVQDSDYLGSGNNLSDSAWTANFKVKSGAVASGGNIMFYLGFSNNLADSGTTQQSATMKLNFSPTENNMALSVSRGNFETSSSPVRENANIYTNTNLPFSTDFYMTMTRSGDVFTLKAYSNSARTTQVGVTATVTVTGISALRYIKAFNDSEQNHSGTSTGNRLYDMEITNGADTWTRQLPTLPTISDLVLHLDANASSTITKDSSNLVATWGDGSSASNDVTASGTTKPLWIDNVQNGLPVIRFDGSDDRMTGTTPSYSLPNTLFMVCTTPNADSEAMFDGDTSRNLFNRQGTNTYRIWAGAGVTGGTANTAMQVFTVVFNNGSPALNINGSAQSLSGTNIGTSALDDIIIGSFDGGTGIADMDVCEVLFYNKALSSSEITDIESYLNSKWSVY